MAFSICRDSQSSASRCEGFSVHDLFLAAFIKWSAWLSIVYSYSPLPHPAGWLAMGLQIMWVFHGIPTPHILHLVVSVYLQAGCCLIVRVAQSTFWFIQDGWLFAVWPFHTCIAEVAVFPPTRFSSGQILAEQSGQLDSSWLLHLYLEPWKFLLSFSHHPFLSCKYFPLHYILS